MALEIAVLSTFGFLFHQEIAALEFAKTGFLCHRIVEFVASFSDVDPSSFRAFQG